MLLLLLAGCSSPSETEIVPPQPEFTAPGLSGDPIDHRIYADVDPNINAIWIEWKPDTTHTTTGYLLRRSLDSAVGGDGVLSDSAILIAKLETTDQTIEPLPTSYRDTAQIFPGATYFYQLQPYHRSPSGTLTYGKPTHVDLSTSYHYTEPVQPYAPTGPMKVPVSGITFSWHDPKEGGTFQLIVERLDTEKYVLSDVFPEYGKDQQKQYDASQLLLMPNGSYRWRIKRIILNGGSSSRWTAFAILP